MKRKHYQTTLNAPKESVWNILWSDDTYPKWTAAFSEGSKAITDWQEGSKVLFLNADNEGMVSTISERKGHEKMAFKHLGMVDKNGNEDLSEASMKGWSGAEEIYHLEEIDGKTLLKVDMDVTEEHEEFFDKVWPRVFDDLKELTEERK